MREKGFAPILILVGIIVILGIIGGVYYLSINRTSKPAQTQDSIVNQSISQQTLKTSVQATPSVNSTGSVQLTQKPDSSSKPVTVPSDWKQFTATDPDFGIKTTMSMPPGYSFRFTGSEFTIQNDSDTTELWDYSTSVFKGWSPSCDRNTASFEETSRCCLINTRNYYSGESRRIWYERLLNGDFSCTYPLSDAKIGTIISTREQTTSNISYIEVTVNTKSSDKNEVHYLYVQNNILHIIKPASIKANSPEAKIPQNVGTIFASLSSIQTK